MQKICSVNELKGHFYVQTTFRVPRTRPPATGRIMIFIYKEPPINSALFSCWTGPLDRPHPPTRPSIQVHPSMPPHCPDWPGAHLLETWSELESDPPAPRPQLPPPPAHIQVGRRAAGSFVKMEKDKWQAKRSVRSINADFLSHVFHDVRGRKKNAPPPRTNS